MSWFTKICQSKPMALPFANPRPEDSFGGIPMIDMQMSNETANKEKQYIKPKYLGMGMLGVATDLPMGYVGKYTDDYDEVRIAKHFQKNPVPCVVNIYNTRLVQEHPKLHMIIMEKVKTLSGKHDNIIFDLNKDIFQDVEETHTGLMRNQRRVPVYEVSSAVEELKLKYNNDPLIDDFIQMKRCLMNHDLKYSDTHSGNIGYDSENNLVLFDLGLSRLSFWD